MDLCCGKRIILATGGSVSTSKWIVILLAIVIALLLLILLIPRLQTPETVQQSEQIPSVPPVPIATFTPVVTPTATRTPWLKNTPTSTPQITPTPTATVTPVPSPTQTSAYVVNNTANVRSGPSTDFNIVGSREQGHVIKPLARTEDGSWIQIGDTEWIWSGLVTGSIDSITVTYDLPTLPTPVPTATDVPIENFHPFCTTDEFFQYTDQLLAIENTITLILEDLMRVAEQPLQAVTVAQQFESVHTEAMNISPPAKLLNAHTYFLQSTMWFSSAGNAFKLAYQWNQSHWVQTAMERLDKSKEFAILADDVIGSLCFQ